MFAPQNPSKTINIAFYLVPEFSMIGFSALVDPLRQANSQSGQRLYQWQVISAAGGPVAASNGMSLVADCALGREFRLDMLVLCAGLGQKKATTKICSIGYSNTVAEACGWEAKTQGVIY